MSQALSFLRQTLPEGVILGRGSEEVGLAAGAIQSDVEQFEDAVSHGRWSEALELYGGDFLLGFHIGDAWGFEDWVEGERARLKELAAGAAWALAQEQINVGALVEAERSAQRALSLVWTDETPVRRFIETLAGAGDRAAALNLYERFCHRLREELDLEPSARTKEVAEAVRNGEVEQRLGPHSPEAQGLPVAPPPPAREIPQVFKRRRLPAWAFAVVGIAMAIGVFQMFVRQAPVVSGEARVVVFPFENLSGDPMLEYLETTLSRHITQGLSWVDEVSVVPPDLALEAYRTRGEGISPRELALRLDADILITGKITPKGEELLLDAEVIDLRQEGIFTPVSASGPADPKDALEGVEELEDRLMGALAISVRDETTTYWVRRPPPSYEASLAYFRGDQSWFAGDFRSAALHFQEAYQKDTTFLFALMNVVSSLQKIPDWAGADSGLTTLQFRREELTPKEQYWLDWLDFTQRGNLAGALEAGRFELERDPRDQMTMYILGTGALRMGRVKEASEAFEGIESDFPAVWNWPGSWNNLALLKHLLGRFQEELDVIRAAVRSLPELELLFLQAEARALASLGRLDGIGPVLARVEASEITWGVSPGDVLLNIAGDLVRYGFLDESRAVAERAAVWYSSPTGRPSPLALAQAYLLSGREAEGVTFLRGAVRADPESLPAHGLYGVALAQTGDLDAAEIEALWVRDLDRPFLHGRDTFWRSAIRAHQGRKEEAVRLLLQAHREGRPYQVLYFSPWLAPLWGYEAYEEIVVPKD